MANQQAEQDGNQFPAQLIHSGTAGTAETIKRTGQASGAADVHVTGGTVSDLNTIGTVNVVETGSVVVTAGTISDLDTVGTVGVLNDGSVAVTALPDLPGGTVDILAGGSVIVTAGTIAPPTGFEGGTVAVGTTGVELTFTGATKEIQVTASNDNSGTIYLGDSNVASSGSASITELVAGQSQSLNLDDASAALYAVASAASQKIYKAALT